MKTIQIKDKVAIVDDADFDKVIYYCWCLNNRGYANASLRTGERGGPVISMHELVTAKAPQVYEIHHKDGNKLNNQRKNLEFLSIAEHKMRKGLQKNNVTGYKGVAYDNTRQKYLASVSFQKETYFVGRFNTAEEAAKAYDQKVIELYGINAHLNFPK